MHSLEDSPCPVKLGLEVHRPYLERRRVRDAIPINAWALSLDELFVADSVDLVTMIDVIEHFEKDDAIELLRQSESVARRRAGTGAGARKASATALPGNPRSLWHLDTG
jgi:hypothetical protein